MKKTLLVILTFLSFISFWLAQESCDISEFEIKGESTITLNQVSEYKVSDSLERVKSSEINVNYSLRRNEQKMDSAQWDKFFYNFEKEWKYLLKADFSLDWCKYEIEKTIEVFYQSIIYIWQDLEEFKIGYETNFKNNSILFNKIIVPNNNIFAEDEIKTNLLDHQYIIKNSDIIIINNKDTDSIFQILSKLSNSENLNLQNKEIFVINNTNKHFMKRLLSKYSLTINNKNTYIVPNNQILGLLSDLSFGKDINKDSLVELMPLSFKNTSKWMILSYLVDTLIANDLPINLIWLLLTLTIATLVVTTFRQIIWISVFGTFTPLLFWLSILVLGTQVSIVFFIIAFIATILSRLITKRLYLLHSAKISLLIVTYFLTILVILWLDKIIGTNIIDLQIFNNSFAIFPIMFLILWTDKVFNEGFNFFSKWQLFALLEFIIISSIVYWIISSVWLRLVFLSYPELSIIVLILIILVWRFTWLQLLEYFRFMPLLKWDWEEEE